jgi:hypothetical protein
MAKLDDEFREASDRTADRLKSSAIATTAKFGRRSGRVVIQLSTGLQIAFRPQDAQGLEGAKPEQLRSIEITPSGLGIHFPDVDADLYLPALLDRFLGSKRWIASELGRLGGRASTESKAAAARRNGKLGGRPRKPRSLQST